jgi:outer membrane protein OmpA-like peptidoglycan-associated protein
MTINVIDAETKAVLPGAMIKEELTLRELGSTDLQGRYIQPVIAEKDEQILVTMAGYRPKVIMLKGQAGETATNLTYTIELIPAKDVYPYEGWYKIIYFDLDKFNVRDGDATKTMDEVVAFLKAHPEVKISLNSHTDSRATKEYNEKLSQRRSKAAKDYLLSKGVSAKQIGNLSWSGESVMVNSCGDEVPCTEEMHQLNRRTEITVNGIIR